MGYKPRVLRPTAARLYRAVMEYELNGVTHRSVWGPYTTPGAGLGILTRRRRWVYDADGEIRTKIQYCEPDWKDIE